MDAVKNALLLPGSRWTPAYGNVDANRLRSIVSDHARELIGPAVSAQARQRIE